MKKTILILGLLFGITTLSAAQNSDLQSVKTTLSYYLDGGTNNDFETLKKALHRASAAIQDRRGSRVPDGKAKEKKTGPIGYPTKLR